MNENNDDAAASSSEVEVEVSPSASASDELSLGKPKDLGHAPLTESAIKNARTNDSEPLFDIRQAVGEATHKVSDMINENIIFARYATVATVLLLGTYGVSKTPFFFRYKSVSDIPSECFAKRKVLHGRIVHVLENRGERPAAMAGGALASNNIAQSTSNVEKPVICLVRHLSPVGRLLSRSAFDFSLSNSPSVRLGGRIEDSRDLLKVEIGKLSCFISYRIFHVIRRSAAI